MTVRSDPLHSVRQAKLTRPNAGQAHGLCFSVQPGVKVPPSLRNIYKELTTEYPDFVAPKHGCVPFPPAPDPRPDATANIAGTSSTSQSRACSSSTPLSPFEHMRRGRTRSEGGKPLRTRSWTSWISMAAPTGSGRRGKGASI